MPHVGYGESQFKQTARSLKIHSDELYRCAAQCSNGYAMPSAESISLPAVSALFQPIVPGDATPRYRQARQALQKAIEAGHFKGGRALPSETVIAQSLHISIGTLRRAVDELVHEHVLVRHQGQGTFVAGHSPPRFMFQFFHVEPQQDFGGKHPHHFASLPVEYPAIECLAFEATRADRRSADALRLRAGAGIFQIENRVCLGGHPVMLDRLAISATAFKSLTQADFINRPGTIFGLYQTAFGLTVLHTRERARAVLADARSAKVLGIAENSPVMEIHRLALTFGDKPVEYRISTLNTQAHDYVNVLSKLPA